MAATSTPHFHNTDGADKIEIGVKEFMCIGAHAPQDHPHVFLDMGSETEKVCPYCSTLFSYDPRLGDTQTRPLNALVTL